MRYMPQLLCLTGFQVELMPLSDDLLRIPQREQGGQTAQKRFGYQAKWALSLVLSKHRTDEDYAVAVEFHDDVVLLNSSTEPTALAFYQVKTKKAGHWTIGPLFKLDKTKAEPASHMGKLFDNYLRFKEYTASLNFVSNSPCNFLESGVSDQPFSASKDPAKYQNFRERLKIECPESTDEICELFRFVHSDLSLEDPDAHTIGKIVEFVTEEIGHHAHFAPRGLFLLFTSEFTRRSEADTPNGSFTDLIKAKAVVRDDVDGWLNAIKSKRPQPKWEDISGQLKDLAPLEYSRLIKEWHRYSAEVMDTGNQAVLKVRNLIRAALKRCGHLQTWNEILAYCLNEVAVQARSIIPILSDDKLKAMTLYEALADDPEPKIQAADAQPQDEKK